MKSYLLKNRWGVIFSYLIVRPFGDPIYYVLNFLFVSAMLQSAISSSKTTVVCQPLPYLTLIVTPLAKHLRHRPVRYATTVASKFLTVGMSPTCHAITTSLVIGCIHFLDLPLFIYYAHISSSSGSVNVILCNYGIRLFIYPMEFYYYCLKS